MVRNELPLDFMVKTDTRCAAFAAMHGDIAVELHALTDDVLSGPIIEEVKRRMNLGSLTLVRAGEGAVCRRLQAWIGRLP